jgi:hypothetical protein
MLKDLRTEGVGLLRRDLRDKLQSFRLQSREKLDLLQLFDPVGHAFARTLA